MTRLALIGPDGLAKAIFRPALRRTRVRLVPGTTDGIDAAIVTAPAAATADLLLRLDAGGVRVLCPPGTASDSARVTAVSHLRFAPAAVHVAELLRSGAFGDDVSFDVRFGAMPPVWANDPAYWSRAAGGVLGDSAAELFDLLGWWFGPLAVDDAADDARGGVAAEALIHLRAGAASGVVEVSRLRRLRNTIELRGSAGSLSLDLETLSLTGIVIERGCGVIDLHRARITAWLAGPLVAVDVSGALAQCAAGRRQLDQAWEAGDDTGNSLGGRKILVTGGTGFIGARLVERLAGQGAEVTVTVRGLRRAARIARFDIRLATGDATAGQEIVLNLAYDVRQTGAVNLAAYRRFVAACAVVGIRRFVQASSIAVYNGWPRDDLRETSPCDGPGHDYKTTKRAIERDLTARAAAGEFDVAIVQPTIVYGPFSGLWTDSFIAALRAGAVALPDAGQGLCNAVYVDDVADAMIAAALCPVTPGDAFIVSGAQPVAWRDLIEGYAAAAGGRVILDPTIPASSAPPRRSRLKSIVARLPVRQVLTLLRARLGDERIERLRGLVVRQRATNPVYRPGNASPALFTATATCFVDKANAVLGPPRVDLAEGLRRTQSYIRWRYGA